MGPKVFFVLWCVSVLGVGTLVSSSNVNSRYKNRSVLPIPGGMPPSLVDSISSGVQMAMEYCQSVFKWDRWNCPQTTFSRRSKLPPNKETAYTKAIIAAGIVHAVTRNCSKGEIEGCGCDPKLGDPSTLLTNNSTLVHLQGIAKHTSDWSWGGCSDDPTYSLEVAKKFLDGLEKGTGAASYVGRHNNKVGREVIRDTMVKKCRCHGVSGSCSLQTCWMQVTSFEEVSRKLREKYKRAVRLTYEAVESSITLGNSAREVTEEKEIPVNGRNLVYLEQSPDYCVANITEEFSGTKGRACSRNFSEFTSASEKKSCRNLCRNCGYRVRKIKRKMMKRCNCIFTWCCEVKCDTCVETADDYFCD